MSVTFVVVSVVLLCFRPIFPFSSFQPFLFIGGFDSSALCRSRRELSNEYLLAKIGVDTAENEPLEVWGKIIQYYSFVSLGPARPPPAPTTPAVAQPKSTPEWLSLHPRARTHGSRKQYRRILPS